MQHLPPVGWGDVATKQDVALLKQDIALVRQDLGHEFEELEERMGLRMEAMESRLRGEMHQLAAKGYRTMLLGMMASTFTVGGLAFAAARLV